jgi:N-acetylneuraminic acid mutarotase
MKTINVLTQLIIFVSIVLFTTCSEEIPQEIPQLSVNKTSFTFTPSVNMDTLTILNIGEEELSWEIPEKPTWIELSKSSGKITTGADLVIITADISLNADLYSDSITIESNGGNLVVTMTVEKGIWKKMSHMSTSRLCLGTAVVEGKIYAIGGCTETKSFSTLEVYDPITDSWIKKTGMPGARMGFGCTVMDGKIYAIGGGMVGSHCLADVLIYDPVTDTWASKAPLPKARMELAANTVNGKIYAIGGSLNTTGTLWGIPNVEEYDPATDTWIPKKNKPTAVWGLRTCVIEGKIYAIGGRTGDGTYYVVEVYDPENDSWEKLKGIGIGSYFHSVSFFDGKIYIFGGWYLCTGSPYDRVIEYDPVTQTGIYKTRMPHTIAGHSSVVWENNIYLIGGTTTGHIFTPINTVYVYDPVADQ